MNMNPIIWFWWEMFEFTLRLIIKSSRLCITFPWGSTYTVCVVHVEANKHFFTLIAGRKQHTVRIFYTDLSALK